MTDFADEAQRQEELDRQYAKRQTQFTKNRLCKGCGTRNDRPEYVLCSWCLQEKNRGKK